MRLIQRLFAAPLALMLALATSAFAQQRHVVDPAALAAAVDQHAAAPEADRAAIHEALARPDVRDVASTMGVDLDRINASIATLDGADLQRAATAARQVNQSYVGGASTVVISTTTIIIALLVIILLVVALK